MEEIRLNLGGANKIQVNGADSKKHTKGPHELPAQKNDKPYTLEGSLPENVAVAEASNSKRSQEVASDPKEEGKNETFTEKQPPAGVSTSLSAQDAREAYILCMDEIDAICETDTNSEAGRNMKIKNKLKRCASEPSKSPHSSDKSISTLKKAKTTKFPPKYEYDFLKHKQHLNIYTENKGPKWYETHDNMYSISKNIVPTKLSDAFVSLPIHGEPNSKAELPRFLDNKVNEFFGSGLTEEEISRTIKHCSVDFLKTGRELKMRTAYPGFAMGNYSSFIDDDRATTTSSIKSGNGHELCIVEKHRKRCERDRAHTYMKRLKYRGMRLMPMTQTDAEGDSKSEAGPMLEPGKDLIFHIRIYRPFSFSKSKHYRGRHSIFSRDLIMTGRHTLADLRDRFICANDIDMRFDVSNRIEDPPLASAKEMFPSGFLFINNVFYVDSRPGCVDTSRVVREWAARQRGLGEFTAKDMCSVRLQQLVVRLGHPEVYMHQGKCEHLFTFSEVRLVGPSDPLRMSQYPCHTAISQNQTVYCTTCAEFGAKWIVTGCHQVPFDPAFFCDTCLKLYLYVDNEKVGDFKAYSYRGNEMNMLKPLG